MNRDLPVLFPVKRDQYPLLPPSGMYGVIFIRKKGKGKGNLFYVKNTGSGCPSLPSQGLMIEVFDIHVKRKKKKDLKTIY